jgi:uncharacterized protein
MRVLVRVKPGAGRTSVGGSRKGELLIEVNAPPVDGKATAAALKTLAKALGIAPSDVVLVRGATSRTKLVEVPESCAAGIADLLAR